MDLSSLEGPPLPDSSFNVRTSVWAPRGTEIPRIHFGPTPSTSTSTWAHTPYQSSFDYDDYPPRPASSEPTALRRYHRTQDQNAETHQFRRRSYNDESPGLFHPPSSWSNTYRVSESDLANHAGPQRRNSLVWCEAQKIWLALERHASGNTAPALSIPQSQSAEPYHAASPGLGQSRSQSQSRDRYMDGDDLPPPYGNHYYDRILAAQPMSSSHGQYPYQSRRPGQVSRWGAVARRMNRSPGP